MIQRRRIQRRAFTLTEVLISVVLFTILSIAAIQINVYSSRVTRLNSIRLTAKNLAQGLLEEMVADEFAAVGPDGAGALDPTLASALAPAATRYADIAADAADPLVLDHALGVNGSVSYTFKGYGTATGGSASTLTRAGAAWTANEWAGDVIYLLDGAGLGQFVTIASNTADTLTFQAALDFAAGAGSKFMINNGKTVEITVAWQFQGRDYSHTTQALIVNHNNSANLGF